MFGKSYYCNPVASGDCYRDQVPIVLDTMHMNLGDLDFGSYWPLGLCEALIADLI